MTDGDVAGLLGARRWAYSNELDLQDSVQRALDEAFPGAFTREHAFGPRDRIDFFARVPGIGLEVKAYRAGGAPGRVLAQLLRYAERPEVNYLIIFGGSPRNIAHYPRVILGKPLIAICAKGSLTS